MNTVSMPVIETHGMRMPKLGLGTWTMTGAQCRAAVEQALAFGYRHVDTAQAYGNEAAVGEALASGIVPRAEIHVTTKVGADNLAPDAMRRAMDQSLAALKTDYVDLYLIHWPSPRMDLGASLATMLRLRDAGKTRAIGVSNFPVALMRRAVEEFGAPIACNQVEYHVMLDQSAVLSYARAHGIAVAAYSPLGRARLIGNPVLERIGGKHGASAAQVALKWLLDQDMVAAIPKAQRRASQQANLDALKLFLDDEDRAAIAALPKHERFINPGFAPEWD